MNLEQKLLGAIADVEGMTIVPPNERDRITSILSAFRGYLTEEGTTTEQDELLREIGVRPPK